MNEPMEILRNPLVLPIVLALAGGALAYVLSRVWPLGCKALAVAGSVAVIVCGVMIVTGPGVEPLREKWVSLTASVSFDLDLAVTPLGMLTVIGSGAFALLISVYSFRAMAGDYWEGKFYAYLIWALGGACIVGLAGNLLILLIGWELVTLMLFLMINQGKGNAKAGGAKAYGVLGFADGCLLLAIALLCALEGGSANLSLLADPVEVGTRGGVDYLIYILIMIAALAKAGAIPLHTWIPSAAQDAPTPVMAYMPAALDKLLGIYLLAVLTLRLFRPSWPMQVVMMIVGGVTILAAVLMAMIQHNLKKLLSFHAVSQVGYMVLGIGTGTAVGVIGGLFHMVNHAIYKSNLFLMSGTISRAAGTDEIEDMGGLARMLPITFACSLVSAAAISGIPPLNGFVSKWLVYQGALEVSAVSPGLASALVVVAVFGSALTLASFVKVIYSAFLSPAPKDARYVTRPVKESGWLVAPMVVLAAACILFGLMPGLIINNVLIPAQAQGAGPVSAGMKAISVENLGYWSPTQATGLILLAIVLGLMLVWIATRGQRVRIVRPFLAGEVPPPGDDRFRVPGTGFYETIEKLPVLGGLLRQGQRGAMDVYHWSATHGHALVELLRAQHTGLLGLYVTWCLVGLTVMLVYLLLTAGT